MGQRFELVTSALRCVIHEQSIEGTIRLIWNSNEVKTTVLYFFSIINAAQETLSTFVFNVRWELPNGNNHGQPTPIVVNKFSLYAMFWFVNDKIIE
jgi:hypothetical protein